MSKMRKKRNRSIQAGCDRHHVLFYRKEWDKGYRQKLRRCFVYEMPVGVHQKLHKEIGAVPALSEAEARELWVQFQSYDSEMSLWEALEWLISYSPSAEFSDSIKKQYAFLRCELGR